MVTDDLALAKITTSIASAGVDESSITAPMAKTLAICPSLEVATTLDVAHTSTFEAPIVTLAMKELLVQLAPALMGAINAPPSTFERIPAAVMEGQ